MKCDYCGTKGTEGELCRCGRVLLPSFPANITVESVESVKDLPDVKWTGGRDIQADNNVRAIRAARVMAHYAEIQPGEYTDESVDTILSDLMSDIAHLCDVLETDFDYLVGRAVENHEAELKGVL